MTSSRSPLLSSLLLLLLSLLSLLLLCSSSVSASPLPLATPAPNTAPISLLWRTTRSPSSLNAQAARNFLPRTDDEAAYPTFPSDITSCGVCGENYASLNSCMAAAPLFADVSAILFNPLAFIDVIKCACTETFQAVFPQCVDCFEKTNQTYFLTAQSDTTDAGSFVTGLREVCGLASALLGGVAVANSEVYSAAATTTTAIAATTGLDAETTTDSPTTTSTLEIATPTSVESLATASSTSSSTSGGGRRAVVGSLALVLIGFVTLI